MRSSGTSTTGSRSVRGARGRPRCSSASPGHDDPGRASAVEDVDEVAAGRRRARARAAASARTSRWRGGPGRGVAQGGPERGRAVDADVEASRLGADDAVRGRSEAGDEAQRDAGHLGLGVAGAPPAGKSPSVCGRIVGNFHHERTLPSVDSVASAVRRSRADRSRSAPAAVTRRRCGWATVST